MFHFTDFGLTIEESGDFRYCQPCMIVAAVIGYIQIDNKRRAIRADMARVPC